MNIKELDRGELVAVAGGILLGVSLFLSWYSLGNSNAVLAGCRGPNTLLHAAGRPSRRSASCSSSPPPRPLILSWIIARGHALSWPRGELTAVTAMAALIMTLFVGVIDHPGSPPGEITVCPRLVGGGRRLPAHPHRLGVALQGERRRPQAPGSPMNTPPSLKPDRNLALELVRVTEAAALAAARMVGRGDKEGADQAAVDAMRLVLDTVSMDGVVVIGEGEKDEAPMLYNGEQIGDGTPPKVDIAVDPLEGTRLAALGMPSALAVIALSERGSMFDPGPCVYMEKIAGGPDIADLLDLDRPLSETLRAGRRAPPPRHPRRDGGHARP